MVNVLACIFILVIPHVDLCQACPKQCACVTAEDSITVDCRKKRLTIFPSLLDLDQGLSPSRERYGDAHRPFRKVHLLLSGNRFGYLLQNKLAAVDLQLATLEVENNDHYIDVTPDVLAGPGLTQTLEVLRLGPLRGDICGILHRLHSFTNLREVSLTGASGAYTYRQEEIPAHQNQNGCDHCVLDAPTLPLSLRVLHLVNCGTVTVKGDPATDLAITHLRLAGLRLRQVPSLAGALLSSSLKHLDLSRNLITSLIWLDEASASFRGDCKLETLDLKYNRLGRLEGGVLQKCTNLRLVDLSHNSHLHAVEPGSLRGLSGLTLDLSYTRVSSLEAISPDEVSTVKVHGAALVCDCKALTSTVLTPEGSSMIQGTCRRAANDECKCQKSEVNVEEFILECFSASASDTSPKEKGSSPLGMERGCPEGCPCCPEEKFTEHLSPHQNPGLNDDERGPSPTVTHSERDIDKAPEVSPIGCWVCFGGCVIHGLLLLALLFSFHHPVRK